MTNRVPDLSAVESPPRREIAYRTLSGGKLIGSGGQAVVKRSHLPDDEAPKTVAVKEPQSPSETISEQESESFFEEARTWRMLDTKEREKRVFRNSEHIVGIVDIGDRLPWVAMEYMDGGSLAERLADYPDGLPVDEALWIGECLCRGAKLAHDYGVAHLDLKPANVLFRETPTGTWDVPKIADWGLARVLREQSGSMEALSIEYAAPEQFDADRYGDPDKYTDIYQLGGIVYAMLTGRPPYTGGRASVMHDVIYGNDLVPPSDHRAALSPAVDDAVLRALSTEKTSRYQGEVGRFEEVLRELRSGEETVSTPRPAPEPSDDRNEQRTDTSVSGQWPMFRGGVARTGQYSATSGPQRSVAPRWTVETGDEVYASPAVADGTVYVGSRDRHVYAFDASTGETEWALETDGWVVSSAAVTDGTVYVGGYDNCVYALDAATGEIRWAFETDHSVESSPAVADGTVYVGSRDGKVYALDASTGRQRWAFKTGDEVRSSPAVVNGTVYVGSRDGKVYALDASTGRQRWAFRTGYWVYSSPAVVDGTVYVGSSDKHVYALDASTGRQQWAFETGGWVRSSPAVANGTVYVGSRDDHVYAIDAATGRETRTFGNVGWVDSSPAVADGTVYTGSSDNHVYALDLETGARQFHFETGDEVQSSPVVADGTVYVGSSDNHMYALTEG